MNQGKACEGMAKLPSIAVFVLLTLPWLNPFAPGPTPAVMPWLVSLACFALVLPLTRNVDLVQVAAWSWLGAALLSSAMAVLQYFGWTAAFAPWVNSAGVGEAFANLRQRNQFATLTNIGLAVLLWWVIQRSPAKRGIGSAGWRSLAVMAAALLLALGNAASSSRTGLVQLLLLVGLAWLWSRTGSSAVRTASRQLVLVAVLGYLIAALALPILVGHDWTSGGILQRLHDDSQPCTSRLTLWRNVLFLIAQKPWFGWGWGELAYAHFTTLYDDLRFCDILDNAHNLPLHLAVELGLPLASLLCSAALWLTARWQPWRERDHRVQLAWAVLAVILLHSLLEYPLWYGPFQIAFGLSLWTLWRSRACSGIKPALGERHDDATSAPTNIPGDSGWRFGLAFGLLGVALYAAWDYQRVSQIYLPPTERMAAYRANPLAQIGDSWLFQKQVDFAALTTTALTADNATQMNQQAKRMLHFSPEARVVEIVIESDSLLRRSGDAHFYKQRYQAAFPESFAHWTATTSQPTSSAPSSSRLTQPGR